MPPKISVLTATWNRAPFLEGSLRSVLAQSYAQWEHLVIDDGSTDATHNLLNRLAHPRLRTFHVPNQGQAAALNLGIQEAKGEWLAFLDSDDEFLPNHLELLISEAAEYEFLLGRFELRNCSSDPVPKVRDFYRPGEEIEVAKIEVITGVLFGRTDLFRQLGGFRSVPSTDTDFFHRMKMADVRWKRLNDPSYRYFFGRDPANSMALQDLAADKNAKNP